MLWFDFLVSIYGIMSDEQNFQLDDSFPKKHSGVRSWPAATILT